MKVYVVTNVCMGWDCVCGVFSCIDTLIEYLAPEEEFDEDGELKTDSPYFNASLGKLKDLIRNTNMVIHEEYMD